MTELIPGMLYVAVLGAVQIGAVLLVAYGLSMLIMERWDK